MDIVITYIRVNKIIMSSFLSAGLCVDCPFGWVTDQTHKDGPCYLVTNDLTNRMQRNFSRAREYCQSKGGDLLKIETVPEMVGLTPKWLMHSWLLYYHMSLKCAHSYSNT